MIQLFLEGPYANVLADEFQVPNLVRPLDLLEDVLGGGFVVICDGGIDVQPAEGGAPAFWPLTD